MINIELLEMSGIGSAIKGMRNPMNSWDKCDSYYVWPDDEEFHIGPNDRDLMMKLRNAGTDHRKFMRMVTVYADITAPLYWWKEYDTYKVGTVANSCSTMHTIHKKEFTIDDFSHEHLSERSMSFLQNLIEEINRNRILYVKGFKGVPGDNDYDVKPYDKAYWWQMIQLLPSSFNQMRTIDLDYETLYSIYHQRRNHKLGEWHTFCEWILNLPYMKEFLKLDEQTETKEESND